MQCGAWIGCQVCGPWPSWWLHRRRRRIPHTPWVLKYETWPVGLLPVCILALGIPLMGYLQDRPRCACMHLRYPICWGRWGLAWGVPLGKSQLPCRGLYRNVSILCRRLSNPSRVSNDTKSIIPFNDIKEIIIRCCWSCIKRPLDDGKRPSVAPSVILLRKKLSSRLVWHIRYCLAILFSVILYKGIGNLGIENLSIE